MKGTFNLKRNFVNFNFMKAGECFLYHGTGYMVIVLKSYSAGTKAVNLDTGQVSSFNDNTEVIPMDGEYVLTENVFYGSKAAVCEENEEEKEEEEVWIEEDDV